MHSDLIDWSIQNQRPKLPSFQNDYEIACYLNVIQPMVSSTNELEINMTEMKIQYTSHKLKRKMKNKHSNGENKFVVVSKPKNVKKRHI